MAVASGVTSTANFYYILLMSRIKNKKELLSKWQQKIDSQKYYYDLLKRRGDVKGSFYNSPVYLELNRRRQRAEYRYDNREKIAAARAERRAEQRALARAADEILGRQQAAYSGPAVDAFKGRRNAADLQFAKAVKAKNFVGRLLIFYEETGETIDREYFSIAGYFNALAKIISTLFSKNAGYSILTSTVQKIQSYDKQTDTQYFEHNINVATE